MSEDWVLVQGEVKKSLLQPSSTVLGNELDILLANTVSIYFRAHGYHWNVKGINFAAYHDFFQEIYEDLYSSIDEIGEWKRKLGFDATYTLEAFIANRDVVEPIKPVTLQMMIQTLLTGIQELHASTQSTFDRAQAENEQALMNFLASRIDMLQKWQWQLNTSVNEGNNG